MVEYIYIYIEHLKTYVFKSFQYKLKYIRPFLLSESHTIIIFSTLDPDPSVNDLTPVSLGNPRINSLHVVVKSSN